MVDAIKWADKLQILLLCVTFPALFADAIATRNHAISLFCSLRNLGNLTSYNLLSQAFLGVQRLLKISELSKASHESFSVIIGHTAQGKCIWKLYLAICKPNASDFAVVQRA